ncbi:MAG: RNA polymerase sigma factor [Aureispira sp.]|nr:RNA polymerase sigma factor [Aureispira sp.]
MPADTQHNDNEAEILQLLQEERTFERGFRLLLQTYQERLYWHIRKMVNLHDYTDEVLQNTFIKIYKGIKKFKGNSKLYTWLYRIATNETITFMNKVKKQKTTSLDNEESGLANTLHADSPLDGDEIQAVLEKAIATLPEKQRLVFNMRYFDDMSYKEISEILETSIGGLKASYHHAAKKIESYIKNRI